MYHQRIVLVQWEWAWVRSGNERREMREKVREANNYHQRREI